MTAAWGPIISRHREETRAAFAASCGEQFEIESMSKHVMSKPASSSSTATSRWTRTPWRESSRWRAPSRRRPARVPRGGARLARAYSGDRRRSTAPVGVCALGRTAPFPPTIHLLGHDASSEHSAVAFGRLWGAVALRFRFGEAPKTEATAERMFQNIATTPRAGGLALAVFDATPRSSQARFSRRVTRVRKSEI